MGDDATSNDFVTDAIPGENFYQKGKKFYDGITPDVNGMLGGFGHISSSDIQGSQKFLKPFLTAKKNPVGHHRALDCGAGIGRVTKHLLLHYFDMVDMVEQSKAFLDESMNYIEETGEKIERRILAALQDFTPEQYHYDVIWCQWVLSHLKDDDVTQFLRRSKVSLVNNGMVIIKDNVTSSGCVEIDEEDSTLSRPLALWQKLITDSGLRIVKQQQQQRFPKEIYEVWMFACKLPE